VGITHTLKNRIPVTTAGGAAELAANKNAENM